MDKELETRLRVMFAGLNRQSAADSFPAPGTLALLLSQHVDPSPATKTIAATPQIRSYFATAAVEMWLRSVHSFLISASLTKASPIWASVAGYYSSHYAVRAFAHLFGVFQLYKKGKIARLDKDGAHFVLEKKGNDGEHKFYWKEVIRHAQLANDPFFYANLEDKSDGGHRNKINYWDHICRYPAFQPLETPALQERVRRISTIQFNSVPTPRPDGDHFPDIENVQIVAYHRLVKFRRLVDEACAGNRFWKVQRTPTWCPSTLMNFSVVHSVFVALYAEAS
jgi:hypothetical protein